ncbi:MAG TPA: DUF881 domain-containing protein [bacterium]
MRPTLSQFLMTVTLLVMGFLVATQVKAGRALTSQVEIPTRNVYALATLLKSEREARQSLAAEVSKLRTQQEEYERAAAQGRSLTEAMGKELETLRIALGLKAMRGPGVVVRVEDPKTQPKGSSNPIVVSYQDLVAVINELWAAGAEAVAINGQRITASTGIGQVGGSVVVNLQRLHGPFDITAIGDAATMDGALNIRGGLVESLRALGLTITIKRRENLTVPAFKGLLNFEFAKPAE